MKARRLLHLVLFTALLAMLLSPFTPASAQTKAPKKTSAQKSEQKATPKAEAKSWYLVISPHTPDQCLAAIDAVKAEDKGTASLMHWDWGCMAGDHTGYLRIQAASEKEALAEVPASLRASAKAVKLNKFTEDQLKKFHESSH